MSLKMHDKNTFICSLCNQQFSTVKEIKIHMDIHKSKKYESISLSNDENSQLMKPLIHSFQSSKTNKVKSLKNKQKKIKCNICNKIFSSNFNLKEHTLLHSGEKSHVCHYCKQAFTVKRYLVKHIRIHTGDKPYSCEICKKCFAQKGNLKSHYLTHSGVKSFECGICFMYFGLKSALNRHMRIHSEKPFKCSKCGNSFRKKNSYDRHVSIHENGDDFMCKICGVLCKNHNGLIIHQNAKHFNEVTVTLVCNCCSESFDNIASLRQHYIIHSNKRAYFCDECNMHFKKLWMLDKHNLSHNKSNNYSCDNCSRVFKFRNTLLKHRRKCLNHTDESEGDLSLISFVSLKGSSLESNLIPAFEDYNFLSTVTENIREIENLEIKREILKYKEKVMVCAKGDFSTSLRVDAIEQEESGAQFEESNISTSTKNAIPSQKKKIKKNSGEKDVSISTGKGKVVGNYPCLMCNRSYKQSHSLQKHKKTCYLQKKSLKFNNHHPCAYCGNLYKNRQSLKKHSKNCIANLIKNSRNKVAMTKHKDSNIERVF